MYKEEFKEEHFEVIFDEDGESEEVIQESKLFKDSFTEDVYEIYVKNINSLKDTDKEEENDLFEEIENKNKEINLILFKNNMYDLLLNLEHFKENKKNTIVTFYDLDDKKDEDAILNKVKAFKNTIEELNSLPKDKKEKEYFAILNNVKFEYDFLLYSFEEYKNNHDLNIEEINAIKKDINFINKAKNKIVNKNLKLVIKIAKNYKSNHLDFIDLIQEGNIGLIKGIDKFKHKMGYKLSTYVSWWIRQSINDSLTKKSRSIKLPSNIVNVLYKIKKIEQDEQISRNKYTVEELAEKLEVPQEKIIKALNAPEDIISMNASNNESDNGDKDVALCDLIQASEDYEPHNNLFLMERKKELINIIKSNLTEREQTILLRRFGIQDEREQTLEEIGNAIGLTRERIRQIEVEALFKLNSNEALREKFLELNNGL